MQREHWSLITWALKRLPRRRPRNAVYDNRQVLAVFLWASVHNRSVSWACERSSWPVQAWRRALPDQSTMSRRLADPLVLLDLQALLVMLQKAMPRSDVLLVDGKALPVSRYSRDRQARDGYGTGGLQRGYKLLVLLDPPGRVAGWALEPMNVAECQTAAEVIGLAKAGGQLGDAGLLLGDSAYDSNPLHRACQQTGLLLLAPRKEPGTGLGKGYDHRLSRLMSIGLLEADGSTAAWHKRTRARVEHFNAGLVCGARIDLPPFVRSLRRVRLWVAAKLVLNAARLNAVGQRDAA